MFDLGYIYVSLPPRFTYRKSANELIYIRDEEAKVEFTENFLKDKIIVNNYNIRDLLEIKDSYNNLYKIIKNKYSVSEEFLNLFLNTDNSKDIINDFFSSSHISWNKKDNKVIGLHAGIWHDVDMTSFLNDLKNFDKVGSIDFTDINKNETYVADLYDFYQYISDNFKLSFKYLKGLGESDPEELFDTILNPKTRNLVQLKIDNEKDLSILLDNMFGKGEIDKRKRRNIMIDHFGGI